MKKIFIIGIFRSGTSLLTASLNSSRNILIGWQPYWLFFKTVRNKFLETTGRPYEPNYPMGIMQLSTGTDTDLFRDVFDSVEFGKDELSDMLSGIKGFLNPSAESIYHNMMPDNLRHCLEEIKPGNASYVLTQMLDAFLNSERKKENFNSRYGKIECCGIKELFCEEFIEPLLADGSLNARVIHIIRDPRAVVASRNYGKYKKQAGSKYPLGFIIRSWKRSAANFFINKANRNYLMVKYEDLVSDPSETLKGICNVLDVNLSVDMIDFNKFKNAAGSNWISNSSFGNPESISRTPVNRWKAILSKEEVEIIEYYCQNEMQQLGYEVTNGNFNLDRIRKYNEDISEIREWLKEYDFSIHSIVKN